MVRIESVDKGSIAYKNGILAGDYLISIDGNDIKDVLDYRFYLVNRTITLKIHRESDLFDVVIKKGEYQDIGLNFSTYLMDEKKSCHNKCVFCFIDQLPKGMRQTLYFKDDDSRLSFLMGNYITMTNLKDDDIDRIIKMKMSPVNISVHTTNPELRVKMMKNRFAGDILDKMRRLAEGGITMNCQIVCCKGLNDGEELKRSMAELSEFYPKVSSVSVVPAGITCHRQGLYPLEPFTPSECGEIIDIVDSFANECLEKYGSRIFFCGDELYIKSGRELPSAEYYEGYPQIENGVGMITSLETEFLEELAYRAEAGETHPVSRTVSLATGFAAYGAMCELARRAEEAYRGLRVLVYPIENRYFGKEITVSGLLTGRDMAEQLQGRELGDELLFPPNALRAEGDLFLCGMTPEELSEKIGAPARPGGGDGAALLDALLGEESV